MLTALLVAGCFFTAVLFLVIASWMQTQSFRRAARANAAAGLCCGVSALALPLGPPGVPVVVLACAMLLSVSSLHAVRVGRG
ncbi:MAG: hypothetical protein ACXV0U_11510 [Kineosporiaceae bacterium]